MKRLALLLLFVSSAAVAQIPGPWGVFGGPIPSYRLPAGAPVGSTAFTSDMGLMVSNGLTWSVFTGGGGSGSVTSISIVGANGFSGSVANPTSTPALTIETSITGPLKGAGGALQAAGNVDIYSLFGCAGVSTTYLNGAGGCSTPAGGNVSNTGTPTSGQLAAWTNATTVQGLTPGGDLSLSGSTFTVTKTNGTAFGTFATQNYATPPAIGSTTPAAGAFTTLSASSGTFSSVAGGVTVGSPTGGTKGAGTINMAGCYINGVACAAGGNIDFGNLTAGAPSPTTTWTYGVGTWSGTGTFAATPLRAAPFWNVVQDSAAFPNTGVGVTGLAGGYEWYDNLISGWDGFRFEFEGFTKVSSAPYTIVYNGVQQNTNVTGIKDRIEGDVSQYGIAGSYGGAAGMLYGFNPFVTVLPAATNYAYLGNEFDVNKTSFGGPPAEAHGLNIALAGNCTVGTGPCASEIPALYDDSAFVLGNADNSGSSYWDHLITTGSYAHSPASNLTSTFIGPERRLIGSGTAVFNQPAFRYGIDFNQSVFAAPLSGTYSTAISAITPSTGSSAGTSVVFTFGAMTAAAPPGAIITISGATGTAAVYNGPFVVIGNGSTTTAQVATALAVTCSTGCGTATITEPIGEAYQSPGAAIDPNGNVYASSLNVQNGVSSQTASVGSIVCDPQGFGGYACGAYFGVSNPTIHISTYGSAVAPTINVINSKVVAALLMTDQTSFVSSASGAPVDRFTGLSTQVATGCSASETLTLSNANSGTAATIAITASGGFVTSATITAAGTYTTMAATPTWTTSGTCTTANVNTWLQIGFGISSITLTTNGSGYNVEPAPFIWTTATGNGTIQTMAKLIAVMTPVTQAVFFPDGINVASCTGCGSSTIFQANGTGLSSSGTVNYENAPGIAITNPSAGNVQIGTTYAIDAQTGTTYTILSTDLAKLVTNSNASATAVTVPQATGTFGAGAGFDQVNLGAGLVTNTPTTSTVNGQTTLPLMQGEGASWTSDGTNWQLSATNAAYAFGSSTVAGTGCTPSASKLTGGSNGSVVGTVTLAATCTAITVTTKAAAGTGWTCNIGDRTAQLAGTYIPHWGETASTTTTISIPIPAAAGATDQATVLCSRY